MWSASRSLSASRLTARKIVVVFPRPAVLRVTIFNNPMPPPDPPGGKWGTSQEEAERTEATRGGDPDAVDPSAWQSPHGIIPVESVVAAVRRLKHFLLGPDAHFFHFERPMSEGFGTPLAGSVSPPRAGSRASKAGRYAGGRLVESHGGGQTVTPAPAAVGTAPVAPSPPRTHASPPPPAASEAEGDGKVIPPHESHLQGHAGATRTLHPLPQRPPYPPTSSLQGGPRAYSTLSLSALLGLRSFGTSTHHRDTAASPGGGGKAKRGGHHKKEGTGTHHPAAAAAGGATVEGAPAPGGEGGGGYEASFFVPQERSTIPWGVGRPAPSSEEVDLASSRDIFTGETLESYGWTLGVVGTEPVSTPTPPFLAYEADAAKRGTATYKDDDDTALFHPERGHHHEQSQVADGAGRAHQQQQGHEQEHGVEGYGGGTIPPQYYGEVTTLETFSGWERGGSGGPEVEAGAAEGGATGLPDDIEFKEAPYVEAAGGGQACQPGEVVAPLHGFSGPLTQRLVAMEAFPHTVFRDVEADEPIVAAEADRSKMGTCGYVTGSALDCRSVTTASVRQRPEGGYGVAPTPTRAQAHHTTTAEAGHGLPPASAHFGDEADAVIDLEDATAPRVHATKARKGKGAASSRSSPGGGGGEKRTFATVPVGPRTTGPNAGTSQTSSTPPQGQGAAPEPGFQHLHTEEDLASQLHARSGPYGDSFVTDPIQVFEETPAEVARADQLWREGIQVPATDDSISLREDLHARAGVYEETGITDPIELEQEAARMAALQAEAVTVVSDWVRAEPRDTLSATAGLYEESGITNPDDVFPRYKVGVPGQHAPPPSADEEDAARALPSDESAAASSKSTGGVGGVHVTNAPGHSKDDPARRMLHGLRDAVGLSSVTQAESRPGVPPSPGLATEPLADTESRPGDLPPLGRWDRTRFNMEDESEKNRYLEDVMGGDSGSLAGVDAPFSHDPNQPPNVPMGPATPPSGGKRSFHAAAAHRVGGGAGGRVPPPPPTAAAVPLAGAPSDSGWDDDASPLPPVITKDDRGEQAQPPAPSGGMFTAEYATTTFGQRGPGSIAEKPRRMRRFASLAAAAAGGGQTGATWIPSGGHDGAPRVTTPPTEEDDEMWEILPDERVGVPGYEAEWDATAPPRGGGDEGAYEAGPVTASRKAANTADADPWDIEIFHPKEAPAKPLKPRSPWAPPRLW